MSPQQPVNDIVAGQAKRWLIKRQAGFNEQQAAEFEQWLSKHPDHQYEFQRLQALWQELDMIADDFVDADMLQSNSTANVSTVPRKKYWLSAAVAACLMLVVGLGFERPGSSSVVVPKQSGYYSSLKGEQQTIKLSDGSTLQLGPGSIAQLRFSPKQRIVELIAGEAFFDVAKNNRRPFIVSTTLGDARAVGTAFNVHLHSKQLEVTVHEGLVDVSSDKQTAPARLAMGQQANVRSGGHIETRSDINLAHSAAWRRGTLVFNEQPLYQVVGDLNRYSQVQIVIADDRLLDIEVSGIFKGHDIDAVLAAIEASLPARLTRSDQRISLFYQDET